MNDNIKNYEKIISEDRFAIEAVLESLGENKKIAIIKKLYNKLGQVDTYEKKQKIVENIKNELDTLIGTIDFSTLEKVYKQNNKYSFYESVFNNGSVRYDRRAKVVLSKLMDKYLSDYKEYINRLNLLNEKNNKEEKEETREDKSKERILQSYPFSSEIREDAVNNNYLIDNYNDLSKALNDKSEHEYEVTINFSNIVGVDKNELTKYVNSGLKINKLYNGIINKKTLFNKKNAYLDMGTDLVSLAINLHNTLISTLLDKNGKYDKAAEILNIYKGLEMYKNAYNKFNKISPDLKNELNAILSNMKKNEYKKVFGLQEFDILSPDELRNKINNKVKNNIEFHDFGINENDYLNNRNYIKRATKFMTQDEIVALYRLVIESKIPGGMHSNLDETKRAMIQKTFSSVILDNLKVDRELKSEEIVSLMKTICEEILKDKQVFSKNDNDKLINAKNSAEIRMYGLEKLDSTLKKSKGEYKKFMQLVQMIDAKSRINENEMIDEFDHMFRK